MDKVDGKLSNMKNSLRHHKIPIFSKNLRVSSSSLCDMVSSITHFATWLFLNQDGILVPSSPRLFKNSSSETESSEKPAHCFNNGTDNRDSGSIFTKSDSGFTSG